MRAINIGREEGILCFSHIIIIYCENPKECEKQKENSVGVLMT